MAKITYNVAMSLDGFIAPPDESSSWIVPDDSIGFGLLYQRFDLFIMGRKTYEAIAAAGQYNLLCKVARERVYVVSRTMRTEDHPDITIVKENYVELLKAWKGEQQKSVWIMGGGSLAADCLKHGVVTSLEVAIMPVVLGAGFQLFGGLANKMALSLRRIEKLETSGILMVEYDVVQG